MRTGVKLPDGNTVYPAQEILPHHIHVREVAYREDDPIRQQLVELGKEYADNLVKFDSAEVPEVAMTGTEAGKTSKDNSEIMMNFGVHREAVITTFDPRTIEIFNKKGSSLYGNKEKLERHFTKVLTLFPIPSDARRMLERPQAATMSSLQERLRLVRRQEEPGASFYQLADTQLYGYRVATVSSRNCTKTCNEILHAWNDPTEDLQIFVANINTMSTGVSLHKCCGSGMFLSWHPSASVPKQTMARLIRIGQGRPTAAQSGLPEWLKYEYLENCLCELMKCKWKQPFNRYAWVVEREIAKSDIQYHSDHCIILGHVFSMMARVLMLATEEEQQFWTRNIKHAVEVARRMADPSDDNCQFSTVEKVEKFLSSLDWDKVGKKLKMMFKEVQPKVEAEVKTEGTTSTRVANLRKRVEDRRMKVEEGLVDELGDTADLITPEAGEKRVTIGTVSSNLIIEMADVFVRAMMGLSLPSDFLRINISQVRVQLHLPNQ
ncbi:uncharacterized protein B0J16DRAFT_367827 [Fusarium flagelliforme]|uniref:uncharacterized protein n=1 Tax=Fusarium flagelliforme TaxID=2675880 RepID=UPI001E8E575F|nr:uncharacterized protein B0J16DRAFT_367827 [Fusarium flagelliforme]KAH7198793.1 hypothetical protein B0J16DRAFT_367827 [Fusarium flagelliforme]